MQWHSSLGLPPASNQEFGKYLEKELHVTPDAAPFSGESHWWTPESPPAVLGGSAATVAAAQPPAAARATLGTPAWMNLSDLQKTWMHHVSNEKVQQVQIEVDLQIADRLIQLRYATTYYADLRQSFQVSSVTRKMKIFK